MIRAITPYPAPVMQRVNAVTIAIAGCGVIGRRVAEAVMIRFDMVLAGVADVAADWRVARPVRRRTP